MEKFKWYEPLEKEIEEGILDYLNCLPGCFAFKVRTGGYFDQRRGFYRKNLSKYIIAGTPDILCCYQVNTIGVNTRGLFIGFEVKTNKGRQSDRQKEFQARLQSKANGYYFVVRSIKDVEAAIAAVCSGF